MTRQGYLKWKDTDVFKHWENGGEVQMKTINDKWVDLESITWYEGADYRKKPSNKWDGTEVYEHWLNGGKVEFYYQFGRKWEISEVPRWSENNRYRIPPNHWIRTEPPKDRWILRETLKTKTVISTKYRMLAECWELSEEYVATESYFTPNKWAELPKDGDGIKPTFER